jgi:hypothetical protein
MLAFFSSQQSSSCKLISQMIVLISRGHFLVPGIQWRELAAGLRVCWSLPAQRDNKLWIEG